MICCILIIIYIHKSLSSLISIFIAKLLLKNTGLGLKLDPRDHTVILLRVKHSDQDGFSLHLGVPESQPGVREERPHPEEAAQHHLLRAEDGEDERRGGGGQTAASLSSLVIPSHLQARAKQKIAEDMRKDFEHDRDKLKKVR